jgi:hypothetical protein
MPISKIGSKGVKDAELTADDIAPGTITSAKIAPGTIANDRLANNTTTINGTSIALGASGNIVAGTDWQAVKTANYTAVAGQGIFANTSGGAWTLTLPASPSAGDEVTVVDYSKTFSSENLTIDRNGSNIDDSATNAVLNTDGLNVRFVYVDGTKGWTAVFDDAADDYGATYTSATGGTETTSGNYKIHTFNSTSNFVVASVGNTAGGGAGVSYIVVAGGGGSGGNRYHIQGGGGGGAGGFRENEHPTDSYTQSPLDGAGDITISAQTYPITVGAGGNAGGGGGGTGIPDGPAATNGSNSTFSTITSTGGGAGGQPSGASTGPAPGHDGGSGGGGGGGSPGRPGGSGNTPPVSPPQGNAGGQGSTSNQTLGGSGGGATGAGSQSPGPGVTDARPTGGAGADTSITGSPVTYSTGGAYSNYEPGTRNGYATNGTANTGDGGDANDAGPGSNVPNSPASNYSGKNGGSGVVIIRYKYQN